MDLLNSSIQKRQQVFIILSPYCQTCSQFMGLVWKKNHQELQVHKTPQT